MVVSAKVAMDILARMLVQLVAVDGMVAEDLSMLEEVEEAPVI